MNREIILNQIKQLQKQLQKQLEELQKQLEELEPIEKTSIPNSVNPLSDSGWVCPKCGNVYSPKVAQCWNCVNKNIQID